jgi:TonB-linked SusC/RagA family outer membrane protein
MKQTKRCGVSSYAGSIIKFLMMTMLALPMSTFLTMDVSAQNTLTITGKVLNEGGDPLEGASVHEKGANGGARTTADGAFSLRVSSGDAIIVVSYIGFFQQEIPLGGKTSFTVSLKSENRSLNDVVVVAYGTQKKATLTGAQGSLNASDFKGQPVTRLDQALQGRASGVQVTNASGAPGGDVRIRVRGANSINGGNDPLYVIDGFIGGDFSLIGPDDVESIQILKDASATAPYGSRGANGVIIITTKKGTKGKTNINFTTRLSSSQVARTLDKLNAADYATVVNAHAVETGASPVYTDAQIAGFRTNGGTDWQKAIYRTVGSQQYLLNFSGGNDKTSFYISNSYQNQPGIVNNSAYKFYNIRANINSQITDKFSTYVNFNGVVRNYLNTGMLTGTANPIVQAVAWSPTVPIYDANGDYTLKDPVGSVFLNPVALTTDVTNKSQQYTGNVSGGMLYTILRGLTLNVAYGVNFFGVQSQGFRSAVVNSTTYAGRSTSTSLNLQNTNTLNYKHTFNGVHGLDITAVVEEQKQKDDGFAASITNLIYPSFMYNNLNYGTPNALSAGASEWSLFSLFGRVNYSYMDKYLLSATIRRDGSSRFRGDNKYSSFPSVSAGWVLSQEQFIQDLNAFNTLKLRVSWGKTGNQAISPYSTYSTYASTTATYDSSGYVPGILIEHAENAALKWETTEQKDIGLDMQLIKGSVNFSADYYVKDTRDLLFPVGIPSYIGGGSIVKNIGAVQNKGWEFSLDVTPFKGDFRWTSSINLSLVSNKILHLVKSGKDTIFNSSGVGAGTSTQPEFVMITGQSMAAIWGLRYLGVWQAKDAAIAGKYGAKPGDARYQDINGDSTIGASDYTIIGNGLPRYSIGWNNTFSYKGFDLNIFMQGIFGFDKLDYLYGAAMTYAGDFRQPMLTDIKGRYVSGSNESSQIPAFSSTGKNYIQSSRFVEKGNFIRLKNISLSYTLPKSVVKNLFSIKLFASATNLWTITKYKGMDPEAASVGSGNDAQQNIDYGSYPNPKVFTGGVTINF